MELKENLLGNYIRIQRKKRYMTMSDLAKKCQLSVSHISRIERGVDSKGKVISPSLEVILRIADALEIRLSDLLIESGYVNYDNFDDNPLYPLLYEFLNKQDIKDKFEFDIEALNKNELLDVYQILLNAIDLISLKYK